MGSCRGGSSTEESVTRLLIIKPSSLGDIVHALQVAHAIQTQMPQVKIDWVAREIFAPLVEVCPVVDRVMIFRRMGGVTAFFRLLREIRSTRYDYVLDMQGLARSAIMTAASRGRRKLGRSDAREGARLACHRLAPLPSSGRLSHAVEILLQFCRLLNVRPELAGPLPFEMREDALGGSLPAAVLEARPIVLFPGSRRPEKEWRGFGELTRILLEQEPETRVVWAGNEVLPDPVPVDDAGRFHNLTARTSLEALVPLVTAAGAVVANDSGPMHLAAATGRPTLAVFGPTDPALYGPYPLNSPRHEVVRAPGGDLGKLSAAAVYEKLGALRDRCRK